MRWDVRTYETSAKGILIFAILSQHWQIVSLLKKLKKTFMGFWKTQRDYATILNNSISLFDKSARDLKIHIYMKKSENAV